MTTTPIFFADEVTDTVLASWRLSDPATRERLYIFGAMGAVILIILLWATFIRKRSRRRREHQHSRYRFSRPGEAAEVQTEEDEDPPSEKRRRRRRSGRRHRPRNPTLAETGGLPPIRPEGPPEPQA
jgi:hypothetical protein